MKKKFDAPNYMALRKKMYSNMKMCLKNMIDLNSILNSTEFSDLEKMQKKNFQSIQKAPGYKKWYNPTKKKPTKFDKKYIEKFDKVYDDLNDYTTLCNDFADEMDVEGLNAPKVLLKEFSTIQQE